MLHFADSEQASPSGGAGGRGNVLLVDDAGPKREALALMLQEQGFSVDVAACGPPAIDAVLRALPDAVVVDLCRPDKRNADLCPRMKAAAKGLLPVLHLSMIDMSSEERARVLDEGADACLIHPFEPIELRASVGALVRLARQDRERMEAAAMTAVLRGALDSLADHIALLGEHGEVVAVNRAWSEFARANGFVGPGSGIGMNYLTVCQRAVGSDADEAHYIGEQVRRVVADEAASIEVEYACPSPTEERWFRVGARRMSGSGGVVAIVTHSALTQERLAARAEAVALSLADADRLRLQATLDAIPVGVWISDRNGDSTHSNPAVARIWAGTSPLVSGSEGHATYRAWRAGEQTPIGYEDWPLMRTIRTGETITDELFEIDRFDGTRGYVLNSSAEIRDSSGVLTGAIAITVDVTERQAAATERERLLKSLELERARLEAIFDQAPSFLAVLSGPDFVFERANPAYYLLVGKRDLEGLPLLEAMPELKGQGFVELLENVRATGISFAARQMPVQIARVEGAPLETRYVDMVYQRLVDVDGSFALVAHGVDVTDQVRATNALRHSEEVLREQFAKLPVPTLLWEARGPEFILIDANDAAHRAFPHLRDDSIGTTSQAIAFKPNLDVDRWRCLHENTVVRRSLEFDVGAPVGVRSFDITMGPQQPNRVLVHWEDTTDRLRLEGQLRQSQKLEAVGQLAGGIAHDFNNLLTVIIAYSGMLIADLPIEDENREAIVEIERAAQRAADLTRQLLLFSRKQPAVTRVLDLNVAVREVERLLARLIGSDVTLHLALSDAPLLMHGESGQVGQILMNLVVNANDAMPHGGSITVETALVELDQAFVHRHAGAEAGPSVRLRITDTGVGMSDAVRAQVFEPFFTTKAPGKGTGLGLSAVYGIVRQWNGYVDVTSVLGHGTSITIYVPASEAQGVPAIAAPPRAAPIHAAPAHVDQVDITTTVLLVDDDDAVRSIVCRVLKAEGYRVLEAANGIDALRLLDDAGHGVDVVLSDMVMPGMGGRDLAYEVRNRYPAATLVLMSGYTREILKPDDPIRTDTIFIQKPFTPQVLVQAIKEARASAPRAVAGRPEAAESSRPGGSDRRALDALINGIDAIVWEADAVTDRYHYVSRRAESLLGFPRERWHDEGFWSAVMHPEDRERVSSLRRIAVITGEGFSTEYRMLSATGDTVWIRDTVCTVPGTRGGQTQLGGVMIDVTVTKEAMDVLTLAKETAERADAAKSEFIKLVSHELHTPLNAVIGFANVLLKNRHGTMNEKDLSFVERIAANGRQLLEIVRNVLDVTRMQAGTLDVHMEPVAIDALVEGTVRDLEGAAMEKKIAMEAIVPAGLQRISADPLRMRQVLTNVIGNAIKYTAAGSVLVRVHPSDDGARPVRIEIVDTGQGIQADKLETVFNAFYQAEDFTRRRHEGAGMGLAIARGLCERMGFTLTLESALGVGTTCVIDLAPRLR